MDITSNLIRIQQAIFEQHGHRTDVYYTEGGGALVVLEGRPLHPQNVIQAIPDHVIKLFM
jgi:hypothetical protein